MSPIQLPVRPAITGPKVAKASESQSTSNRLQGTQSGRHESLLRLQQTIGNRATTQLLHASTSALQREIENATYNTTDNAQIDLAKAFFTTFNNAAQKAYQYVVAVPSLGVYAGLNGYTKLWSEKWNAYLSGGRPALMAATFGYVIESLVSESASEFRPPPPSGCSIATQVVSGGTRPDIVLGLMAGSQPVAWLDLTAAESGGHIFDKENWEKKISIFAEVTYPSLDGGTLALMKQNKDNTGSISAEEFEARKKKAQEEYQARKERWYALGEQHFSAKATRKDKRKPTKLLMEVKPELGRQFMQMLLQDVFQLKEPLAEKQVPSILSAMGVNSAAYGYTTGYNQSVRAGEAWLIDHELPVETTKSVEMEDAK